ncbi:MAG TPA: hypothetical protein VFM98_08180 [Ramlibacter sp.]|uniref:hypothetical protein n=1 Tax=Ramlibacter sp. TaxID=1917967 RepID=UPI002D7EA6AC|nr:hypothetical protein [Ramlibacter sp.]HET8745568.1 hypothetical protein [Ramlibacter sp.]
MNKRTSILSIAAAIAASALVLEAPSVIAAGDTADAGASGYSSQSANAQSGVPGVEANVGSNASDRGLPGVEMNVGRDGDQNNTATLGAGPDMGNSGDTSTMGAGNDMDTNGQQSPRPMRTDRG